MCKHLGVFVFNEKKYKGDNDSAIYEHHLFCNDSSGFGGFPILSSYNNDVKET